MRLTKPNLLLLTKIIHYFQSYMAIYKGDELPEPKSMLEVGFNFFFLFLKKHPSKFVILKLLVV
jgi:hypothetical protein